MHGSWRQRARLVLALGAAWLALGSWNARAGFTVTLDSTSAAGSSTVFQYSASIADTDRITAGSFFRIYDFAGLGADSVTAPAGWEVTVSKSDLFTPPSLMLVHGDDPAIDNLTFTYKGAPVSGATKFLGFSASSVFGSAHMAKDFIGQVGLASGGQVNSIGDVMVPNPSLGPVVLVPEPSSLVSISAGMALLGLVAARLRRPRSAR